MRTASSLHLALSAAPNVQEKRELTKQFSRGHETSNSPAVKVSGDSDQDLGLAKPTVLSRFMPTSRRIVQFSDGVPAPPGSTIVYIDGAFDLFHPGHVQILQVEAGTRIKLQGMHPQRINVSNWLVHKRPLFNDSAS